MGLTYYWSKIIKKLRASAILNSEIHKTSKVESGCNVVNTTMDKHSFCGYDCEIANTDIGSFCSIANGVIIGGGAHPLKWVSTSPVFYEGRDSVKAKFSEHKREPVKRTIIGHDVWSGQNVLIKQGVQIGTGAVIGMGSVVTKDVAPYTIVAGVPAKPIKKRFDGMVITKLLQSKWWDFEEARLKDIAQHFNSVDEFIKRIE
jgi:acetyltransferase-like isoleucine patch superfamily enzyme